MSGRLTILVLTSDLIMVKNLQERTKSFLSEVRFVPLSSGEKLSEYASKFAPDLVLIDDAFVDPMNAGLISKMQAVLSAGLKVKRPFFLISAERPTRELRAAMGSGFVDVFTKPVDPSLFFQKIQIYFPNVQFLKDKLLFNMDVNSRIGLSWECHLVSVSEYGATIRLNRELHVGDLFTLHGGMFGAADGDCLGRVLSCSHRQGDGERFEASLLFVAPSKEILSAIRLWIKQEYVRTREATA